MVGAHRAGPVGQCAHSSSDRIIFSDGERHCLRCGSILDQDPSVERAPGCIERSGLEERPRLLGAATGLIVLTLAALALWLVSDIALDGLTTLRDQLVEPSRWRFSGS